MTPKEHWERVYTTKATDAVSWYQPRAAQSLRWIRKSGLSHTAPLVDVGGGASTLVDDLLHESYSSVTVLDLSTAALSAAKARLGEQAQAVTWVEADVTNVDLPPDAYDLWHDRALFHFLTAKHEQAAYVSTLMQSLRPRGHLIISTFAEDGPTQCSGLPVMRYSPTTLHTKFGSAFTLVDHAREEHYTPFGTVQAFVYCYLQKAAS